MSPPGLQLEKRRAIILEGSMMVLQGSVRSLTLSSLALVFGLQLALAQTKEYQPQVGQEGKDVVWVPTPQALVERMLDMARVTVDDFVIDLGSGDGRTVITAAKRGARAHGIEYNPDMVELSKRNAEKAGVADKATFVRGDIFKSDFSQATVISLFLLPDLNLRLRPTLLDMKPGTRVVSNTFDMGDWSPDNSIQIGENCTTYCRAHLWIIPAKVAGTWKLPQGELKLEQTYQMVTGTLKTGNTVLPVKGKVTADQITFTAGDTLFTGRVSGDTIEGTSRPAQETPFKATRGK